MLNAIELATMNRNRYHQVIGPTTCVRWAQAMTSKTGWTFIGGECSFGA